MRLRVTFFAIFISLFYIVGFALLGYGLWSAKRSTEAAGWSTVRGTVTQCKLEHHSDSDGGTTYEVKVQYTYSVGGQQYTGSRLAFGYSASSGQEAHQEIMTALENAKGVEVRYDPLDPASSTLSYGIHRSIQFMLAFAVTWLLFVFGFTVIWWLASRSDSVLLQNLIVH
jgi:hypothetical protein